jgi:hypothetical protein
MKNYKTTIAGAILAALAFVQTFQANGGNLNDWKLWLIPAVIAAMGYVAKDAGVTGTAKLLVGCLCMMSLTSCAGMLAALASPGGQIIEAAAVTLVKQQAAKGEAAILRDSIDLLNAQIASYQAKPTSSNVGSNILNAAKIDGLKVALVAAKQQYKGLTGFDYPAAKNPAASVTP